MARDELLDDPRYQVKIDGEVKGCKCCCPSCSTNDFVIVDQLNVADASRVRFAYGCGRALMPVAHTYRCVNPECPAVKRDCKDVDMQLIEQLTRDGPGKLPITRLRNKGAKFSGYDHEVILSLPIRARAAFRGLTFFERTELVDDDEGDEATRDKRKVKKLPGGCDLALAERLIASKDNMSEIAAALETQARIRQYNMIARYTSFAKAQLARRVQPRGIGELLAREGGGAAAPPSKWPRWRLPKFTDSLLYPTAKNLRSTYVALHEQYKPWLLGDIVRRSPGKGASSDGTFRLMMRTKTDGRVSSPAITTTTTVTRCNDEHIYYHTLTTGRCYCLSSATTRR